HGSRAGRRADEALGRAGAHASSALGRVTGIALIVETAMDSLTITSWMREIDASMRLERDHLVQLDAAIGDGDHGTNMVRGFDAVVDALEPAIDALREGVEAGRSLPEALDLATQAAEAGMRATTPLQARKGRASYLGERSVGHQDPGATSTALIIRALQRAITAGS